MFCFRSTYVSVRANGRISDGGVFGACSLAQGLEEKSLNVPLPSTLPDSDKTLPYVVPGDEAFPLKSYLMRPYPRRELNQDQKVTLQQFGYTGILCLYNNPAIVKYF